MLTPKPPGQAGKEQRSENASPCGHRGTPDRHFDSQNQPEHVEKSNQGDHNERKECSGFHDPSGAEAYAGRLTSKSVCTDRNVLSRLPLRKQLIAAGAEQRILVSGGLLGA